MEEETIEGGFDFDTGVWYPEYEYSFDQASKDIFTYGPLDVVKTMLLKLDPKSFTSTCGTNIRVREICRDRHFQQTYFNIWSEEILKMVNDISMQGKLQKTEFEFYKIWSEIAGDKWEPSLLVAAARGQENMVKFLLKNPKISKFSIALAVASEKGHTSVVKLLLQDGRANPTKKNNQPIRKAAERGHTEVVRLLLQDPRVDPTANGCGALRNAIVEGHTDVVKLLLEDGRSDPGIDNNEAIIQAAEGGYLEIVKLLLQDPRVDPSAQDWESIKMSKRGGHKEVTRLLGKYYRRMYGR